MSPENFLSDDVTTWSSDWLLLKGIQKVFKKLFELRCQYTTWKERLAAENFNSSSGSLKFCELSLISDLIGISRSENPLFKQPFAPKSRHVVNLDPVLDQEVNFDPNLLWNPLFQIVYFRHMQNILLYRHLEYFWNILMSATEENKNQKYKTFSNVCLLVRFLIFLSDENS